VQYIYDLIWKVLFIYIFILGSWAFHLWSEICFIHWIYLFIYLFPRFCENCTSIICRVWWC